MSTTDSSPASLARLPSLAHSTVLVRRAQEGEQQAVEDLLRRYYDRILRLAQIRLGRSLRAAVDPEDIAQEACLRAFRSIGSFELRGHASIINWLAKIVENQVRDAQRHFTAEKRDRSREERLGPFESKAGGRSAEPAASSTRPSMRAYRAELAQVYDECIGLLEGDEREVILLREYTGADWDTIAAELGRPGAPAVRQLYRRARIRLASQLGRRIGPLSDSSA